MCAKHLHTAQQDNGGPCYSVVLPPRTVTKGHLEAARKQAAGAVARAMLSNLRAYLELPRVRGFDTDLFADDVLRKMRGIVGHSEPISVAARKTLNIATLQLLNCNDIVVQMRRAYLHGLGKDIPAKELSLLLKEADVTLYNSVDNVNQALRRASDCDPDMFMKHMAQARTVRQPGGLRLTAAEQQAITSFYYDHSYELGWMGECTPHPWRLLHPLPHDCHYSNCAEGDHSHAQAHEEGARGNCKLPHGGRATSARRSYAGGTGTRRTRAVLFTAVLCCGAASYVPGHRGYPALAGRVIDVLQGPPPAQRPRSEEGDLRVPRVPSRRKGKEEVHVISSQLPRR